MTDDKPIKDLRDAERAIAKLSRIFWRIGHKDLAEYLLERDKGDPQCRKCSDAAFVGQFLDDIWTTYTRQATNERRLKCVACGEDILKDNGRRHARYCSDKCKQKAYRARNGLDRQARP